MKTGKKVLAVLTAAFLSLSMTTAAAASQFVPSIEAKDSPQIIQIQNLAGEWVDAIIYDKNGNEVASAYSNQLIVTPYAKKDQANQTIKSYLEHAYDDAKTDDIGQLSQGVDAYLAANGNGLTQNDLIISEVFDASLVDSLDNLLDGSGTQVSITFKTTIKKGSFLMVMINCNILNGGTWDIIPAENITWNDDGTVTILFPHLCPILFITSSDTITPASDSPSSPQTSDDLYIMKNTVIYGTVLAFGLAALVFMVYRKNRR